MSNKWDTLFQVCFNFVSGIRPIDRDPTVCKKMHDICMKFNTVAFFNLLMIICILD